MEGRSVVEDLFRRAQAGEERAIEDLSAYALDWLCRWGHGRLPHWARGRFSTADLAQMTVWRFLQVLHRFEPATEDALRKFLTVVFRNALRDEIRRARRRGLRADETDLLNRADARADPLEETLNKLAVEHVLRSFEKLSPTDQALIAARFNVASSANIAAEKGFPTPDAARAAVNRALRRLTRLVEGG